MDITFDDIELLLGILTFIKLLGQLEEEDFILIIDSR
jgi:hypothetical protein